MNELEKLTMKLLAYYLIQYVADANGVKPPTDDEIEPHCDIVIDAVRKKARRMIIGLDLDAGK